MDKLFTAFLEPFGGHSQEQEIVYKQAETRNVLGAQRSYVFSSLSKPGIGSFIFKFPILSFQVDHYLKYGGHIKPGG